MVGKNQVFMSRPACLSCAHWELKTSPMREHGMGLCAQEVFPFRQARTFGPTAPCNKAEFTQATPATIAAREKALKRI